MNDVAVMVPEVKISIGKIPGQIRDVFVKSGTTIKEAYEQAGMVMAQGENLTFDGRVARAEDQITAPGSVLLTKAIRGN